VRGRKRCGGDEPQALRTAFAHARPATTMAQGRARYRYERPLTFYAALVPVDFLAFLELIFGAAIGANCAASLHDLNVDARMHAPQRRIGAGAIDRKVFGFDIDSLA